MYVVALVATTQVAPAGDEVIVYPVIAEPPLLSGTLHEIVAELPVPDPVTPRGDVGTLAGVTAADADDADIEFPVVFDAVALKV